MDKNNIGVGIDFGGIDLRVVYDSEGAALELAPERGLSESMILFDSQRNVSSLGVGFPSVLHSIGSHIAFKYLEQEWTPETLVASCLAAIADRIRQISGAAPGPSAIAVPSSLSQRRRQILLECATRAGFDTVSLVDRSIAVALAMRTDKEQSSTFVVFTLDYNDCEVALARLARGRCWILGTHLIPRVSGERFDALIMEEIILALRDRQIFLGLRQFTSAQWVKFRTLAESSRHRLALTPTVNVTLEGPLAGPESRVLVRLDAHGYGRAITREVADPIAKISLLLENSGLENDNIDGVVLVGEAAIARPVTDILTASYGEQRVWIAENSAGAIGALHVAAEAAGRTQQPPQKPMVLSVASRLPPLPGSAGAAAQCEPAGGEPERFASIVSVTEGPAIPTPPAAPPNGSTKGPASRDRLTEVRQLHREGRLQEALEILADMSKEIEDLRQELHAVATPSLPQQLIQQAQALLIDGQPGRAVTLSHSAFAAGPGDPTVFAAMMRIHIEAGLALNKPEEYQAAIGTLLCAHHHDQTDRAVHKALAERHYQHALAMVQLNNLDKALEIIRMALTFDPRHVGANELLARLNQAELTQVQRE